jgi:hypothetical protein
METDENLLEEDDLYIFYPVELKVENGDTRQAFTMYKRVDKKVKPVSTTFSPDYEVRRTIPEDPLKTLPDLPIHPPEFQLTSRLTKERMELLEINTEEYLTKDEENCFNI